MIGYYYRKWRRNRDFARTQRANTGARPYNVTSSETIKNRRWR